MGGFGLMGREGNGWMGGKWSVLGWKDGVSGLEKEFTVLRDDGIFWSSMKEGWKRRYWWIQVRSGQTWDGMGWDGFGYDL